MPTFSGLKSNTHKQLNRVRAALSRWNRRYARMKTLERKKDTRRKIQLGGLVKKAGLENESTAVLFGLLLEAADTLESKQANQIRDEWRIRGDLALTLDQNENVKS